MLRDRPDVIVATPAGLLSHIRSGHIHLKNSVETLVVDEADLVLSFGEQSVSKGWRIQNCVVFISRYEEPWSSKSSFCFLA